MIMGHNLDNDFFDFFFMGNKQLQGKPWSSSSDSKYSAIYII